MAFALWNPADKSTHIILSNGNLTATGDGTTFTSVRGTHFKSTGKWYCEFTLDLRSEGFTQVPKFGVSNSSFPVQTGNLGATTDGWAYQANGSKFFSNIETVYGAAFTTGDVISMLYDADADTLSFWKNGVDQGQAFTSVSGSLAATFMTHGSSAVTANFGATAFTFTPPGGFTGWEDEPVNELTATTPTPVFTMGGGAALEITTPAPTLSMGGGAELAATTPMPAVLMGQDGLAINTPAPVLAMDSGAELVATTPAPVLVMFSPAQLDLAITTPAATMTMGTPAALGITTPAASLAMIGEAFFHRLAVAVPAMRFQATGQAGTAFGMNLKVPAPILALRTAPTLAIRVPIRASMSGINGGVGSVKVKTPLPQMAASGKQETLGSMKIRATLRFSAFALSENLGNMRPIIIRPRLVTTGLSGANGTMGMEFPFTFALAGYPPYEGTMAVFYPTPTVEIGITSEIAAATRTWVLNLRRKALTEYSNFEFNSYGVFRDALLSAGDAGLFLHAGQDDDAGTPIAARVRTGKESFGTSLNKRVPRIYANFRANGDMRFMTITSQGGERVYALPYNGLDEVQERRVPVGRGPKSPYWQFEMLNVNGSDFLIEKMQPYPEKSYRRVV